MRVRFSGGPLDGQEAWLEDGRTSYQCIAGEGDFAAEMEEWERYGPVPASKLVSRLVTYREAGRVGVDGTVRFAIFVSDDTPRAAAELIVEAAVAELNTKRNAT